MVVALVSWRLEGVEAAEVLVDGGGQLALGLAAAVGRQVGPEQRVQDVAGQVEGVALLEADDRAEVALVARLGQLVHRVVQALDVGGVVLVVVQLEDLGRVVRLEGAVVVGQIREGVGGHGRLLWDGDGRQHAVYFPNAALL